MTTMTAPASPASSSSDLEPEMDITKIPDWLLTHPGLHKRGIVVHEALQPFTVYATQWRPEGPIYVVKAINPSRPEADFYDLFDRYSDSPTDHTVPHEVIRCDRPLLVMPFASRIMHFCSCKTSSILATFDQVLEGVEHLHRLHVAHGDLYTHNVIGATERDAGRDPRLTAGRVYLIDFETCRQFEHGPGVQTAVPLPNTHVVPPLGMTTFDPYSWDVYCLGRTLEGIVQERFMISLEKKPRIPGLFARWLKGNEAGCTSVCHCRPTVTRARQVLVIVRWFVQVAELVIAIATYVRTLFETPRGHNSRY
ncbi:hypothetical protein GSI_02572 [Ganoderma sinense ZZ0214-1]|uniref:Protein kinase domain-containing protein n=1 Tax=Ganoderma sinense ZZ0214-1 TaxID=1077348 RepID=A0A2G8SLX8_9APHY|nr:hypothetical protein GSI_02572 [Ganoderma sinense ZZ0214-1]